MIYFVVIEICLEILCKGVFLIHMWVHYMCSYESYC